MNDQNDGANLLNEAGKLIMEALTSTIREDRSHYERIEVGVLFRIKATIEILNAAHACYSRAFEEKD